jgi:Transmembrane secretion effector
VSDVWLLYALATTASVVGTISAPARQTFVPSLLPTDKLAAGLALNRVSFQVVLLVGPALAGGVVTVAMAVVIGAALPHFARYQAGERKIRLGSSTRHSSSRLIANNAP